MVQPNKVHGGMIDWSSLGKHNAFRSLRNLFGIPKGAPELTWLEIPTVSGPRTLHPFLMPHEFFASYFSGKKQSWARLLSGPSGAPLEFWRSMRGSAFLDRHPSLPRSAWAKTIPIGFHGDGGAFSHHDSLNVISWNSLLDQGGTASKKFLFTVVKKSEMVEATMDVIFDIMCWSFNAMLVGKWPLANRHGAPDEAGGSDLAGGWRGSVCQCRGDWKFYTEIFRFPQWNSAERMCWMCRASSTIPDLYFGRFGPGAGWRATRWSHEGYLEYLRGLGIAIPVLLIALIGFRLECIMVDTLHTVDQGVASHILGNVFWYVAVRKRSLGGGTT